MTTANTKNTNAISISVKVNPSDVLKAVIAGNYTYWVKDIDTKISIDDIYDNNLISDLIVKFENPNDETKTRTKTISTKKLCEAYVSLLVNGATHCFGHNLNVENYDSCFGDLVLQHALFNEIVFG